MQVVGNNTASLRGLVAGGGRYPEPPPWNGLVASGAEARNALLWRRNRGEMGRAFSALRGTALVIITRCV